MREGAEYLGDFTDKLCLLRLHGLNKETQTRLFANTQILMCTNCAASVTCLIFLAVKRKPSLVKPPCREKAHSFESSAPQT